MRSPMAEQIQQWLDTADHGDSFELSEEWLKNIIHELEYTASAFRASEQEGERKDKRIQQLEAELDNRKFRRKVA